VRELRVGADTDDLDADVLEFGETVVKGKDLGRADKGEVEG
jgi:hypothetical protein